MQKRDQIQSLATGEFLYQKYACGGNNPNIDYSCIVLEYYTALELLVNTVFYYPYLENVLKVKYSTFTGSGNRTAFLNGYLGGSDWGHISRGGGIKDNLELGTISWLYKDMFNIDQVDPKYV